MTAALGLGNTDLHAAQEISLWKKVSISVHRVWTSSTFKKNSTWNLLKFTLIIKKYKAENIALMNKRCWILLFPCALHSHSNCNNRSKINIMNWKKERGKEKEPNLREKNKTNLGEKGAFWHLVIILGWDLFTKWNPVYSLIHKVFSGESKYWMED